MVPSAIYQVNRIDITLKYQIYFADRRISSSFISISLMAGLGRDPNCDCIGTIEASRCAFSRPRRISSQQPCF